MSAHPVALRDLAAASAVLALHAEAVVGCQTLPSAPLLAYLRVSQRRVKEWWQALREAQTNDTTDGSSVLAALAEEMLVAELPVRVAAAVFAAFDARHGAPYAAPFGWRALLDHLQARHQVLARLVAGPQPLHALLRVNQLRRKTERWSDSLLALLPDPRFAAQFAIDPARMLDFRNRLQGRTTLASRQLLLMSLRLAMPANLVHSAQRSRTHRELMRQLLALWPRDALDVSGLLHGPLGSRLWGVAEGRSSRESTGTHDTGGFAILRRNRRR